jgi:hypothetical protein
VEIILRFHILIRSKGRFFGRLGKRGARRGGEAGMGFGWGT